jgi:propanol-preferring alcohol dehydrogenase
VVGPANYVTPIPEGLSSPDAAPMLCAGVTVYSAIRKSGAQSGQWIVVAGAGGGLGHLATQIASRGMALRVIGVDHGSKESLVKECGAEHFIDITKHDDKSIVEEVKKLTTYGASAVIVCTASNKAYAQGLDLLRFGGTLVCVGMPEGDMEPIAGAFPSAMVVHEKKIIGSAVGNNREAAEVLDLAARGLVKVHYKIEKMDKLTEVFKEMADMKMMGRVVLDLEG